MQQPVQIAADSSTTTCGDEPPFGTAGVNPGLILINRENNQPPNGAAKGGRRAGAGRPKGAITLNTRAIIEAAQSGGEMPIAYMLRVMRDENAPDARRDRMARAAAAYLHSKLSMIEAEKDEEDASTSSA